MKIIKQRLIMMFLSATMISALFGCTFSLNEGAGETGEDTVHVTSEEISETADEVDAKNDETISEVSTETSEATMEKVDSDQEADTATTDANDDKKAADNSKTSSSTENSTSASTISIIPPYSGKAYIELNNNSPAFTDDEKKSTESFELYSDLDELGRCGVAFANVNKDIMPTKERGEIGEIKPSGWHTVKYPDLIEDNYLYNRSHLIAYSLAGENANEKNLISGTRYLNQETMQIFELKVLEYVRRTDNHVLYRVTPYFEGDNLLATGVQMEAWSVEDEGQGICFNVFCYNVQPGIEIDYATGESRRAEKTAENTIDNKSADNKTEENKSKDNNTEQKTDKRIDDTTEGSDNISDFEKTKMTFILNTNSKKVHLTDCKRVKDIADKNKLEYEGTLAELKQQGYKPCGWCLKEYK